MCIWEKALDDSRRSVGIRKKNKEKDLRLKSCSYTTDKCSCHFFSSPMLLAHVSLQQPDDAKWVNNYESAKVLNAVGEERT